MGRLLVYGGSWNLPEAPDAIPSPFVKYIEQEQVARPSVVTPSMVHYEEATLIPDITDVISSSP